MSNNDTVTIGKWSDTPRVYTFKTTLVAGIPYQIKIGVDADTTLANLVAAINGDSGSGTKYTAGTPVHPTVSAGAVGSNATILTAKTSGMHGDLNVLKTSAPSTRLSLSGAFMTGGVDAVANEVLRVTDDDTCLANLDKAIRGAGTEGTDYSTGTVAHSLVTSAVVANVLTVTAKSFGVAANALATLAGTTPDSHQDWLGTTLGGAGATAGVDAIPNEIIKGATAAALITNIKAAILATGASAGTLFSTGTVVNPDVVAGAISGGGVILAISANPALSAAVADALPTTTDETNLAWEDTTLGGGTGGSDAGIDATSFDYSLTGSYQL